MLRDNIINKTIVLNGITYFYDTIKLKWLSIDKYQINFGINHKNINTNRWMALSGIYSNNIVYKNLTNGTITAVVFQAKSDTSSEIEIIEKKFRESLDGRVEGHGIIKCT